MKMLSIVTLAIFPGLGGAALANGQNSQQSDTNATGPNPFMTFSDDAFGSYPVRHPVVQHPVVHHHIKK
jgi:hypothetical protein